MPQYAKAAILEKNIMKRANGQYLSILLKLKDSFVPIKNSAKIGVNNTQTVPT